jgi:hypothetical protein
MNARAPLLWLALLCSGCGSYQTDLENLCNVTERMGGRHADDDPATLARRQANWLSGKVRSKEGTALFVKLGQVRGPARAALVRAEATSHGIASCPLADAWVAQDAALQAENAKVDAASAEALKKAAEIRALGEKAAAAGDAGR